MAITKEIVYDKVEIVGEWKALHCREATVIKEDGVELSRSFHRHVLHPSVCSEDLDSDGIGTGTFTHTDTDISGEPQETQDIAAVVWTDAVKALWRTKEEEGKENPV